ncbi:MAG: serine/threonine-protein kinase [Myxococcota bacterium]|jgi:serine/threonine-protein kinase|nr:serine/threonine-protein kinase [Myxococcota bacterium]
MTDRYRLGNVVYADGAGALHAAYDTQLARPVDVKVLRGRHATRERRRLEREARLLGGALHPALPRLIDARFDDESVWLVYHHVDGHTLAAEVSRARPSPARALEWARDIGSALHAAHAQGIVHTDLRPEVVLVSNPEGTPIVHGFGRARGRSEGTDEPRSTSGSVLELPLFVAPEILLGERADVRTDVFGVAALLYFMLTGRPPADVSDARSAADAIEHILRTPPPRLRGYSPNVAELVERGLARDPARRPASMLELNHALLRELGRDTDYPGSVTTGISLAPGDRVGDFLIETELGSGGFGRVYLAKDLNLQRDVALKLFVDRTARPQVEARALARVRHPNVVRVFGLFEHAEHAVLVSEHVPGASLDHRLAAGDRPSLPVLFAVLDQTLAGLEAIHAVGIHHGDLKPANVVVDADWNAKLIDFGLARVPGEADPSPQALTPAYAAPERITGEQGSAASDLYSFGIFAFELATGRLPFPADTPVAMMRAHVALRAPSVGEVAPTMAPLNELVARCLAKAPDSRPTATAARELLATARRPLTKARRILVVDDDADVGESLVDALTPLTCGGSVEVAHDGEVGLALARAGTFDVVLLDLQLPRRNGFEVLAELVATTLRPPPVIIVSGQASSEDWRLLSAMGAKAILFKPLDPRMLESLVLRVLSNVST